MSLNSKSVYFILLILVFSNINVSSADPPDAGKSSIDVLANVNVLSNYTITVSVKDVSNFNLDVLVHLTTSDGVFSNGQQSIEGNSSVSGQFVAPWTSPSISFLEENRTVTFTAIMDFGGADIQISQDTLLTHEDDRAIINSLSNLPTTLFSGEVFNLYTQIKDINSDIVSDIQVTYTSDFGSFSDPIGMSDAKGFYNTTFIAPAVHPSLDDINLTISILIEASDTISLTLSGNISTVITDATSLTVNFTPPSVLESGQSANLEFEVYAGVSPAFGGTVTVSTTEGTFTGGSTIANLNISETGFANIDWFSPTVSDNTTVSLSYDIFYLDSLNATADFDILVYYIVKDLNVTITVEKGNILQNETNVVTVSVKELISDAPVENLQVQFGTGVGIWVESSDLDYVGTTNSFGIIQATFDASSTILPFEQHTVIISITISSTLFNPVGEELNFTLIRSPPKYNFTVSPLSVSITAGDTLSIDLHAYQNELNYANATFSLFATAGEFEDGELLYRDRTDNNGLLTIVWASSTLSEIQQELKIFITVELVNSGLELVSLEINLSPDPLKLTIPTVATTGVLEDIISNPGTAAAIVGALIGVVVIGVVVTKKMK